MNKGGNSWGLLGIRGNLTSTPKLAQTQPVERGVQTVESAGPHFSAATVRRAPEVASADCRNRVPGTIHNLGVGGHAILDGHNDNSGEVFGGG